MFEEDTDPGEKPVGSHDIFSDERAVAPRVAATDAWLEPARRLPVHRECDVLVVGGGPSGTAAAVAAARQGAQVVLLERYNHLGGLSTGGLVIWIDRMTDWEGRLVIRGFAEEVLSRLPADAVAGPPRDAWGSRDARAVAHWSARTAAFRDVVTWSPTIDPERLKIASQELALEAGVQLMYHAWAADPLVKDGRVCGAAFESKAGRRAILARVVVDATGDGDMFSRAGAAFDSDIDEQGTHRSVNTAWMFAGVDMERWIRFKEEEPSQFSAFMRLGRERIGVFERPYVSWRNDVGLFLGPRLAGYCAIDVDDQTAVEVRSRRLMAAHLDFYRDNAPGFEHAYLLLGAPQLGVRHSRRLRGVASVRREHWPGAQVLADEIGVSPSLSPAFPNISVPFGSLVPRELDGLLACGRHISCDASSHGFLREIPQCWLTGQAAGTAAALAVSGGVQPRAVEIVQLQAALRKQNAFVRPQALQEAVS